MLTIQHLTIISKSAKLYILILKKKFMEAYCVKCKAKQEMKDSQAVTLKNGKPATKGTCPVCGTGMFRIGKPVA